MDLFDFLIDYRGRAYGIEYLRRGEKWALDPCLYSNRKAAEKNLRGFRKHFADEQFRLVRITANVGLVEE